MTKHFSPIDFHGKVVFHIGPHKTGSTSIQHFMEANYNYLRKQGVLYPQSGRIDNKGKLTSLHHPLIKSFFEKGQIATETQIQNLKDEIESSGAKVVIISSEVLARENLNQDIFGYLREIFRHAEKNWVLFLRRQDRLVLSRYSESVKVGITAYPAGIEDVNKDKLLNHRRRLETLESLVHADRIIPISFDASPNIIDSFAHACGISISGCEFVARGRNESLPWGLLQIMRVTNRLLPRSARSKFNNRSRQLVQITRTKRLFMWGAPLSESQLSNVLKQYDDSNRWVEAKYFQGKHVIGD